MNILFVCTGNTCRSPMAEGYLKNKIPSLSVESRGISAMGDEVSKNAQAAMEEIGIDIKGRFSEPLTAADIAAADKIICMSPSHLAVLKMYAPAEKISILGGGIPDHYGGYSRAYRECRNDITKEIDEMIEKGVFCEIYAVSAEEKHMKAVAELENECFGTGWDEKSISKAYKDFKFFVAVCDRETVGYISINSVLDEGYIGNVAVAPQKRGRGIGKILVERAVAYARDNSLSFLSLEVRESNKRAISLYQKVGFKNEGVRKGFYKNPKEDGVIMTKRFD